MNVMKKTLLLLLPILFCVTTLQAQTNLDDYWGYVNTLQGEWLRKICTQGLDTVYIAGENGLIAKSTDRGETWEKYHFSTRVDLNDIKFIDHYTGFAVGENGTVLKTTDAGENWTQRIKLDPTGKPEATFCVCDNTESVSVYEYCNIHGLWSSEL